jgi:hypothetical protein
LLEIEGCGSPQPLHDFAGNNENAGFHRTMQIFLMLEIFSASSKPAGFWQTRHFEVLS